MFEFCRNAPEFLRQPRRFIALACAVACLGLTACSSNLIYKPEVVQGNFVSREQVQALRAGMPRQAVRDVLGTPLLTSVFHADRWDFVFTLSRQGAESQSRRVTVFFAGDKLERYEADDLPSEAEFVATLKAMPTVGKLPPMEATAESLQNFPPPAAKTAPPAPAAKAPTDYPPLEPLNK